MPSVNIFEAVGVQGEEPGFDNLAIVVGTSSAGPTGSVGALYGDPVQLKAIYGDGPMVSDAGAMIRLSASAIAGRGPSLACRVYRTPSTVAGEVVDADTDASGIAGTAMANVSFSGAANDSYALRVVATSAIVVATSGRFKYALNADSDIKYSDEVNLGTNTTYTIPGTNVTIDFGDAADTWIVGDYLVGRTRAPKWNTTDLDDFFAALKSSAVDVAIVYVAGRMDADEFQHVKTGLDTLATKGKRPIAIVNARRPHPSESDTEWMASVLDDYDGVTDDRCTILAGYGWFADPNRGITVRRDMGAAYLAREVAIPRSVSPNYVSLGPLPNFTIHDRDGNLIGHDEHSVGGLDAAKFVTTYIVPDPKYRDGCYVFRPWVKYPSGSRVTLSTFRRLSNAVERVVSGVTWADIGNRNFSDAQDQMSTADQGAIRAAITTALQLEFTADEIQNIEVEDPAPAPPLVYVNPLVTKSAGLTTVYVTVSPHFPDIIDGYSITIALQV